uniref:Retrotransposon gag domain-containing protein n=1 Tax=Chenopodium quinoa TaxID=63459 RepID=A0A803N6W8_CHEQI
MDSKVAASIPYFEKAKRLWDYLEKCFCISNGPSLQQLRVKITDCKQTKGMSVEDYYTKLMVLFDDLTRLKPFHGCECGHCTCDVADKYSSDREEKMLHQFLIGVDDYLYATVQTNFLSQQPLADLNRAYQALLQEKESRDIARGRQRRRKRRMLMCSVCCTRKKSCWFLATVFKAPFYPAEPAASASPTVRTKALTGSSQIVEDNVSLADFKLEDVRPTAAAGSVHRNPLADGTAAIASSLHLGNSAAAGSPHVASDVAAATVDPVSVELGRGRFRFCSGYNNYSHCKTVLE